MAEEQFFSFQLVINHLCYLYLFMHTGVQHDFLFV